MRSTLAAASLLFALVACHDSSSGTTFLTPGVNDLGLATEALRVGDGILATREFEAGQDRNGDGDGNDTVLHVVDLASGRSTLVANVEQFSCAGGFVACTVPEDRAGQDLDGDGDQLDAVLFVVDGHTGTSVNLGLAAERLAAPVQSGAWVAFAVPEADQGVDLDGDGELQSELVHVYDARRGVTTRLAIPTLPGSEAIRVQGSWLVALGAEDQRTDLDGDADLDDVVLFAHDLVHGTTRNLGHAVDELLGFDGHLLASRVSESEQSADLNGDGDADDELLELDALDSGAQHVLAEDALFAQVGGGLAFFELDRSAGRFVYEERADTFTELAPVPLRGRPQLADRRVAFVVDEVLAGDQNQDGDDLDAVLFVYDARTGTTTNTRLTVADDAGRLGFDAQRAAFLLEFGGMEMRPEERIMLGVRGNERGEIVPLYLLPADFRLVGGKLLLVVSEAQLRQDDDGDQDLEDSILFVHDLASGRTLDTHLPVSPELLSDGSSGEPFDLDGAYAAVGVSELAVHMDGNGDGDEADTIVHVLRLR